MTLVSSGNWNRLSMAVVSFIMALGNLVYDTGNHRRHLKFMQCFTCHRITVYPKKYAHGFVVLCFVVVMQSSIMNSHEVFIHIHQGCFAGTGAIVRLPQCQWSKPDGYGKISQCITTTKHSKAKTVCIFLGIYLTRTTRVLVTRSFVRCMQIFYVSSSGILHLRCIYLSKAYIHSETNNTMHLILLCTEIKQRDIRYSNTYVVKSDISQKV